MINDHFPRETRESLLRSQDRYVEALLQQHPHPPRPVPDPWYPVKSSGYITMAVIFLGFFLFTIIFGPSLLQALWDGSYFQLRHWPFGFAIPFVLSLSAVELVRPLYHWHVGLRYGRPAVVTVVEAIAPKGYSASGVWEVTTATGRIQRRFREVSHEHDTWVARMQPGDRVYVLLHPTKDHVLLAYGPV